MRRLPADHRGSGAAGCLQRAPGGLPGGAEDQGRRGGKAPAAGSYATLNPQDFVDGSFGLPTVQDIIAELEKPGRDPRPAFAAATFSEGIEKISDLRPGMVLEGTVTNVAAFGAFVDVGVHQDGLVHVSALANRFVSDPREVVKSGQVVRVKVLEADPERKRISLTLRLDDEPAPSGDVRPAIVGPAIAGPAGVRTRGRTVRGRRHRRRRRGSRPGSRHPAGGRPPGSRRSSRRGRRRSGAGQHGDGRGAAEGRTREVAPGGSSETALSTSVVHAATAGQTVKRLVLRCP